MKTSLLVTAFLFCLTAKAGFGAGFVIPMASMIAIPLVVDNIFQVHKGFAVEIGTGIDWMFVDPEGGEGNESGFWNNGNAPLASGIVGVRYQAKKGFLFKFDHTPFTNFQEFYCFFGFSFGYSFPWKKKQLV